MTLSNIAGKASLARDEFLISVVQPLTSLALAGLFWLLAWWPTLVRMARKSTGRPGFATPPGAYVNQRRVASKTMTSVGIARASYYVPHVRWPQYFSADGMALHANYWKAADQFGIPSSHWCAALLSADAQ